MRIIGLWINGVEKVITLKNNGFLECFGSMKRGYPQNRAKTFKALYFYEERLRYNYTKYITGAKVRKQNIL